MNPILEAIDLAIATPSGRLLAENISFRLRVGESLLVSGPNGAGKSTLLRVLLHGKGQLRGEVKKSPVRVGWIPQIQNIGCHLPLRLQDVLEMAGPERRWKEVVHATSLLPDNRLPVAWDTASGGERQRTLLARALVNEPDLLFLDEPFNHLDPHGRRLVEKVLAAFVADGKKALVIVSHLVEPIATLGIPVVPLEIKGGLA